MYSFLRRPAWILSHVLVAVLVIALVGLGFWQRARYLDEKDKKERFDTLATGTPAPFDRFVPPGATFDDVGESLRYRRVEVTGTFDPQSEVAILNRSQAGAPGAWVLTPLIRDDGPAVAVVRGWIPYDPAGEDPPFTKALPATGQVTVTGNIQLTQRRGSIGPIDPAEGRLSGLARVDLERLDQQLDYDLAPVWVLQDGQEPPQEGALPSEVTLQTEDPSQNFSYMVQWWIFAAIAAGGYPLVLRAVARSRARGDQVPDPDHDDPGRAPGHPPRRGDAEDLPAARG